MILCAIDDGIEESASEKKNLKPNNKSLLNLIGRKKQAQLL
jgi:hypothetical protein